MPLVIMIECSGCGARTPGVAVDFPESREGALHALREEAESLRWERVRACAWFCPDCCRIRSRRGLVAGGMRDEG